MVLIDFLGLLLLIPGLFLINEKNRLGFLFVAGANLAFMVLGVINGNYFFVAAGCIAVFFQIVGFIRWGRKSTPEDESGSR